jgi:xanthine phosphoribosyltransferase
MTDTAKITLTWDDVKKHSLALAKKIGTMKNLKGIVCVARGGLVPTAIIANALNIRNVKSVAVVSYHGMEQQSAEMLGSVDTILDGEGWVFIDDLADTGQTAKLLKKRYPGAKLAVPFAKPAGKALCDYIGTDMPQDIWVEFPWEI